MTRNSARKKAARKLAASEGIAYADALRRVATQPAPPRSAPGFTLGVDPSGIPVTFDLPLPPDAAPHGGVVVGHIGGGARALLARIAHHFMQAEGVTTVGHVKMAATRTGRGAPVALDGGIPALDELMEPQGAQGTVLILDTPTGRPGRADAPYVEAWGDEDPLSVTDHLFRCGRNVGVAPWACITTGAADHNDPDAVEALIARAGTLIGVGDFREFLPRKIREGVPDTEAFRAGEGYLWHPDGSIRHFQML